MQQDIEDRDRRIIELEEHLGMQTLPPSSSRSKVVSEGLESTGVAAAARGALGSSAVRQGLKVQSINPDEVALHTLLALRAAARAEEGYGDEKQRKGGGQGPLPFLLEEHIAKLQATVKGSVAHASDSQAATFAERSEKAEPRALSALGDSTSYISLVNAAWAAGVSDLDLLAADGVHLDGDSSNLCSNGTHSPEPPSPGNTWKAAEALVADAILKKMKPSHTPEQASRASSRQAGCDNKTGDETSYGACLDARADLSTNGGDACGGGGACCGAASQTSGTWSAPKMSPRGRQATPVSGPMRHSRSLSPAEVAQVLAPAGAAPLQWQGAPSFRYAQSLSPPRSAISPTPRVNGIPSALQVPSREGLPKAACRGSLHGSGSSGCLGRGPGSTVSLAAMTVPSTVGASAPATTPIASRTLTQQVTLPLSAMAASRISASSGPCPQPVPSRAATPATAATLAGAASAAATAAAANLPFLTPPPLTPAQSCTPRLARRSTPVAGTTHVGSPQLSSRVPMLNPSSPRLATRNC